MNQIALPLDWPAAEREGDFITSAANLMAVRHLGHLALWPLMATIMTGPRKSGRSFLGRIFAARSGATLIDDADRVDEEKLFHAWNSAQSDRRPLLIIADQPPPIWSVSLSDLGSRLAATPHIAIEQPDDMLIAALFERLMAARGLAVGQDVTAWLVRRIERSYVAIHRIVDLLDDAALSRRSRINLPLVRETLRSAGVIEDS